MDPDDPYDENPYGWIPTTQEQAGGSKMKHQADQEEEEVPHAFPC